MVWKEEIMEDKIINIDANFIKEIAKIQEQLDDANNAISNLFLKMQDGNRMDIKYDGAYSQLYNEVYMFIAYVQYKHPNIYKEYREHKELK